MSDQSWKNEFRDPSCVHRGKPFWSWNGKLDKAVIREQIDTFAQMGYGGFHIHSRVGLADEYMGEKFMDCVRFAHGCGVEKGMQTWLYDEDKWPSGSAGGRVTRRDEYRARCLMISRNRYEDGHQISGRRQVSRLTENGTTKLLAAYRVSLDADGYLEDYARVSPDSTEANWFGYRILSDKLPWFNEQSYADLLNPGMAQAFIEQTHEKYRQALGDCFSDTIPAIFTDEPQHSMAQSLKYALGSEEPVLPYTEDMDEAFEKAFGYALLDRLPEVFWNDRGLVSRVRWQFHDWVTQRFTDAYFGSIYEWCEKNGLMSAGHVMREGKLQTQTEFIGEAMRLYTKFHLPGLDILANDLEYTTAKQVQSIAHQYGKPGVICEMLGVTNWDFDFAGHKFQSEWLSALGVTVRVPHLAWMYMGGESKRDYPAALDGHSPWHTRYSIIEDSLARVSTAMQQGAPQVRVAMIHPVESYWAVYGPEDQTGITRERMERNFQQIIEWLLFGQIDFDYVSESLLPELSPAFENGRLRLGEMAYEAIVVPPMLTMRAGTLEALRAFAARGGRVIFMGALPGYIDAKPADVDLPDGARQIGCDRDALMDALAFVRDIYLTDDAGKAVENLVYQLRTDGEEAWLFAAPGKPADTQVRGFFRGGGETPHLNIAVRGSYHAEWCDCETGNITPVPVRHQKEWTHICLSCYPQDSVLLHLSPPDDRPVMPLRETRLGETEYMTGLVGYRLHEPNAMLLDMAEYRLDEGEWQKKEEILRLDDRVREAAGYQKRTDAFVQPWVSGNANPIGHIVELKYAFESEIDLAHVDLAYEGEAEIIFNGTLVDTVHPGFYIDHAMHRIALGRVKKGINTLGMRIPFGPRTNLEACYLLGAFGVRVMGDSAVMTALPEKIGFGPLLMQGFPFYGGSISYFADIDVKSDGVSICVPKFNAPLVDVILDGGETIAVYRKPWRAQFSGLTPGKHRLELIAYGSRINQFGQVHNCSRDEAYFGPNSWRSKAGEWSYAYQLRETGILSTPFIQAVL